MTSIVQNFPLYLFVLHQLKVSMIQQSYHDHDQGEDGDDDDDRKVK